MEQRSQSIMVYLLSLLSAVALGSCGGSINTNHNPHFDEDGYLIVDTTETAFAMKLPSSVQFYIEVSGSMNGFFRANKPTEFKTDLWKIVNYFSAISPEICVLTNDGNQGSKYSLLQFQTMMNTGAFVSTASTKVPVMLNTIVSNLDAESGEMAVLVSDMKYSPVGSAAPDVLLAQYSTDVSRIIGTFGKAVSLICATSDYLDRQGGTVCSRSPYYYFVIGSQERVAMVRNQISTLLETQGHFVDNFDSGINYGKPKYSFGPSFMCEQLDDEPTFTAYEEIEPGIDTCKVKLKVNIEDYRWLLANVNVLRESFKISPKYGSKIEVGDIVINDKKITEDEKRLERKATATIDIKIMNMPTDSEVIEWTLDLPNTDMSLFSEFFIGADNEDDPSRSYSVMDFMSGMFHGSVVNKQLGNNYILISKKN